MLADGTTDDLQTISDAVPDTEATIPPPLRAFLPPAMPDAALLLRLLASTHNVDLQAISDVIRNDIGLVVGLFHRAAFERRLRPTTVLNIGELVIHAGLSNLKTLAAEARLHAVNSNDCAGRICERFWMRSRSAARLAEELAEDTELREPAYIAGLLRNAGTLPAVLGWRAPGIGVGSAGEIGYQLAKVWQLPIVIAEVIRGDERACTSQKAVSLLRLANLADQRVAEWESARVGTFSIVKWS